MAYAAHFVDVPRANAQENYRQVWEDIDAQQLRYPEGRLLHLSWVVDDVLHVVDVWDSPEQQEAYMRELGPILERHDVQLVAPPEIGELLQIVVPASAVAR